MSALILLVSHIFFGNKTQLVASVISLATSFFISCKAHRALILLLLASNRDPLRWARGWVPPLRGGLVCHGKDIDFNRLFQKPPIP